jgi:hypothetical protein
VSLFVMSLVLLHQRGCAPAMKHWLKTRFGIAAAPIALFLPGMSMTWWEWSLLLHSPFLDFA